MKSFFNMALLLFSMASFSQYKISGYVTDANNQKLQGVAIHVEENNIETTTDDSGYYEINALPKGQNKIIFNYIGFETKSEMVYTDKVIQVLNVQLVEKEQHLDEVIVSTLYNKIQSQNVMKVEHASVNSLKQKGATTLIDGLATLPGVAQIATGNSIGKPVIRGLSGNRVLVYSQGIRMENQQFGEEHGLGLNASGIESVEVIKGPASLLYGSDAIGGVIYFNPEKYASLHEKVTLLEQQYFTNTQGTATTFGFKASPSNFKFLVKGNYTSHADYKVPNDDRIINTRFIEKDFKAGIGFANSKLATDFRYNYNNLNLGLPEEDIENSGFRNPLFPKQEVDNHVLSLNQKLYFKNSKIEADFGYSLNDRKELEALNEIALSMKLQTASYNLKYYLPKMGKWEAIIGTQGIHQINTNFGEELLIPNAEVNDFGVYATTNFAWKTNVLQAGLRFDNRNVNTTTHGIVGEEGYFEGINKQFTSFNASLGYKTNVLESITTRINIASGFRAPNLAELTSNGIHEGANRYEVGNANLNTEQNFQTDLNLEYKTNHVEFFVNGFYNHIANYIYLSPTGTTFYNSAAANFIQVYNYSQSDANLYGGEIGLHFHPHPLDWLHFETSYETVTGKKQSGEYLPLIPANNWNNTLRFEWNDSKWLKEGFTTISLSSTFNQNKVSGFETRTGGYSLLNLGIGGTLHFGKTKVEVNLNANNITDKKYMAHLSRLKTDGILNMGRNVVLGLHFNF